MGADETRREGNRSEERRTRVSGGRAGDRVGELVLPRCNSIARLLPSFFERVSTYRNDPGVRYSDADRLPHRQVETESYAKREEKVGTSLVCIRGPRRKQDGARDIRVKLSLECGNCIDS